MGEIEIREKRPYTIVCNDLIMDSRLRLQTRAVLILMLSRPPDWDYSIRGMAAIAGITKDTMSKMFHELESAGYVKRKKQLREGGRFATGGYIVSDTPELLKDDEMQEPPCPKIQDTVEEAESPCPNSSYTVSSYTKNYDELNNKQVSKEQDIPPKPPKGSTRRKNKSRPDWKPERFEGFWHLYPRGENKQGAIRAWDKLEPSDELIATMGKALLRQLQSPAWKDGIGIPYASTWLNNARWTDTDKQPTIAGNTGGWAADSEVI